MVVLKEINPTSDKERATMIGLFLLKPDTFPTMYTHKHKYTHPYTYIHTHVYVQMTSYISESSFYKIFTSVLNVVS